MTGTVLLAADDLSVHVGTHTLLRGVSFTLRAGESLTLLGESGAGKSLLAQAVVGNLPTALRAAGSVTLDGTTTRAADAAARRPAWGRTLAVLPQEPALALDPLGRIAPQLAEVHALVRGASAAAADAAAAQGLADAGLAAAAQRYPWQISGGMAQRAAATIALAGGARALLADEPTKGLDAHWRAHTVALLQSVQKAGGCVVTITHDIQVARALGGQVIVLRHGEVVEQGDAAAVLAAPRHPFTRALLAAQPAHWPRHGTATSGAPVLHADDIAKRLGGRTLFEGIDMPIHAGQRWAVQGPSGTGKSTLGNVLLGLLAPDAGQVRRAPALRRHALQKLYQDPVASFAPKASLERSLRDVARLHGCSWASIEARLQRLRLPDGVLARRPFEVSGGELQRIALARALAVEPALLFADEPTSRLDPITQQDAMATLLGAAEETGAALVLVTHDPDIAAAVGSHFVHLHEPVVPTQPALV
ncbi:ABC transporter ATP-binding protein [Xylophilus sp. Leaf220]|uniref:ABC transporter ATP-binding protein n=1 Tax=Xylophilus sp. Leaf220 TaxID=1735686 RepID=UPI0006F7AB7E|nr:ATP-binding cassette domain-containing protein [Xylophilus sp. Leaf220]KQM71171.1 ABC transporter ATP-binding protein [Xylophilus sp. Leaf220]